MQRATALRSLVASYSKKHPAVDAGEAVLPPSRERGAFSAIEQIVALAALDDVTVCAAIERVIAVRSVQSVVA